jgi:hypothetical protein
VCLPFIVKRTPHKWVGQRLHSVGLVQLEEHASGYLLTTSPARGGASSCHWGSRILSCLCYVCDVTRWRRRVTNMRSIVVKARQCPGQLPSDGRPHWVGCLAAVGARAHWTACLAATGSMSSAMLYLTLFFSRGKMLGWSTGGQGSCRSCLQLMSSSAVGCHRDPIGSKGEGKTASSVWGRLPFTMEHPTTRPCRGRGILQGEPPQGRDLAFP